MKPIVLTANEARAIAHKAGVCFEIVSKAVDTSKAEGKPATVAMQMLGGRSEPDAPPTSAMVVLFSAGHALEARNTWSGFVCAPLSNQKDMVHAGHLIQRTIEIVAAEVDGTFIRL